MTSSLLTLMHADARRRQASLDRGFGRCVVLRTHKSGIKKYRNGAVDRVVAPAMRDGRPERGRDRALDADGIAEVGGYINDGAAPLQLFRRVFLAWLAPRWPPPAGGVSILAVTLSRAQHQWGWLAAACRTILAERALRVCGTGRCSATACMTVSHQNLV